MHLLLYVRKPLFHCVQGHTGRFVSVRGNHDCRITFQEGADENWIKYWPRYFVLTYERLLRNCGRVQPQQSKKSITGCAPLAQFSSIRPYLLWDKFVVIHYRKARNPDEFPFCMIIYLWIHDHIFRLEAWCEIIYTLWPISSSDSPVRATSASIFAAMSPLPPKDSGPNIRIMYPAASVTQTIIGIERPLIALVAWNCRKAKTWKYK